MSQKRGIIHLTTYALQKICHLPQDPLQTARGSAKTSILNVSNRK